MKKEGGEGAVSLMGGEGQQVRALPRFLWLKLYNFNDMAFYKKMYNKKMQVYYPHAVTMGDPVDTKTIATRLAQISTVSLADVAAVLACLPEVMAEYMGQGKSVRLEGLGTFRIGLDTVGVTTEEEFDFQKQVKAIRVRFNPQREGATTKGGMPTRALVPAGMEWTLWSGVEDGASPGGGSTDDGLGEDDGNHQLE